MPKFILTLLVWSLGGSISWGQDCSLIRETDPYTKLSTLSTGYHKMTGGSLVLDASKAEIDWMLEVGDGKVCFNDEASIQVFFEGSKLRLLFRNSGTLNCEGLLHVLFKNSVSTNYQLTKLATLPIKQIVVTNPDKKSWIMEPTPEQRANWMRSASCLVEESKKLLTQ